MFSPFYLIVYLVLLYGFECQDALRERKIKFCPNRPAAPHLNGKVERSQRTDRMEFWATVDYSVGRDALGPALLEWQRFYSEEHSHSSLRRKDASGATGRAAGTGPRPGDRRGRQRPAVRRPTATTPGSLPDAVKPYSRSAHHTHAPSPEALFPVRLVGESRQFQERQEFCAPYHYAAFLTSDYLFLL